MKTPAEVAAERQSQEDEARQARVDLRDVLDTEAGLPRLCPLAA